MKAFGFKALLLVAAMTAVSACSTVSKNPYLRAAADFEPEDARMWSRPGELGYELRDRVEATVSVTKVFGITVEGEQPPQDNVIEIIAGLVSGDKKQVENPLVRHAAAKAVDDVKGDGIYVLRAEIRTNGLWPFYEKQSATVRGVSLVIKDLGQVSVDRADRERMLKASPRPCGNCSN
jgi:hypothetical protein